LVGIALFAIDPRFADSIGKDIEILVGGLIRHHGKTIKRNLVEWFGVALGITNTAGATPIPHLEAAPLQKNHVLERAFDQCVDAGLHGLVLCGRRLGASAKRKGKQNQGKAKSQWHGISERIRKRHYAVCFWHAASRIVRRPFHGHITQISREGANGGFARYRLIIEPWLAFLGHNQDNYLFQDKTVVEIVDELLGDWAGQGKLVPAWEWRLADPAAYTKRGMTVQYLESDLAFLKRLLAEEGDTLGKRTLGIADSNQAFTGGRN